MERLVEVIRAGFRPSIGPEYLDYLIFYEAMLQGNELKQRCRFTAGPIFCFEDMIVVNDLKTTKHINLNDRRSHRDLQMISLRHCIALMH